MKKRLLEIIIILFLAVFAGAMLVSCKNNEAQLYDILFDVDGGAPLESVIGDNVILPTTTKEGFVLRGWEFANGAFAGEPGKKIVVGGDIVLKAVWETGYAFVFRANIPYDPQGYLSQKESKYEFATLYFPAEQLHPTPPATFLTYPNKVKTIENDREFASRTGLAERKIVELRALAGDRTLPGWEAAQNELNAILEQIGYLKIGTEPSVYGYELEPDWRSRLEGMDIDHNDYGASNNVFEFELKPKKITIAFENNVIADGQRLNDTLSYNQAGVVYGGDTEYRTVYVKRGGQDVALNSLLIEYGSASFRSDLSKIRPVSDNYEYDGGWTYYDASAGLRKIFRIDDADYNTLAFAENMVLSPNMVPLGSRGLQYKLNADKDGYVVYCTGPLSVNVIVPDTYAGLPVTEIDARTFSVSQSVAELLPINNTAASVKTIRLPSSIKTIGSEAFKGASSLTKVFTGTEGSGVFLPRDLESLGRGAFMGCTSLLEINIPLNVSDIPEDAFMDCTSLIRVITTASQEKGLRRIGAYAFYGCTALPSFPFRETTVEIGESAFENCTSLVHLDNFEASGIELINKKAFYNCTSLMNVSSPVALKLVGDEAFSGCTRLYKFQMGNGLLEIGREAFKGVAQETFTVPRTVQKVGARAFYNARTINYFPSDVNVGWSDEWNLTEYTTV
ncbi:MAG: leucine-rich repeat protein [Christensenellaceae bacterium]|nr:leucine-rich repeat protein [Christensenellaceae bacterium]